MNIRSNLWRKLAKSKKYREEFVAAQVKRGIPFQARALLKRRGWSQDELAERAKVTQGVVSRAVNPEYGNLTLNTIIRLAAGFDVAFIGKFVRFSELDRWFSEQSEISLGNVPAFDEENAMPEAIKPAASKQGQELVADQEKKPPISIALLLAKTEQVTAFPPLSVKGRAQKGKGEFYETLRSNAR